MTTRYDDEGVANKLKRTYENYVKAVVEENSKIVGMLLIEVKEEKGQGKILEIDEILVDKDKRRQGIGKALIDFAKKIASEKNCRMIS